MIFLVVLHLKWIPLSIVGWWSCGVTLEMDPSLYCNILWHVFNKKFYVIWLMKSYTCNITIISCVLDAGGGAVLHRLIL